MRSPRFGRQVRVLLALACCVGMLAGCGGRANSFDIEGEQVVLRLLTAEQLEAYPKAAGWDRGRADAYAERYDEVYPPGRQALGVAAVAGAATGLVIDLIRTELEKEATRYEQQFGTTVYDAAFWQEDLSGRAAQHWAGFELLRYTNRMPYGGEPAFRFVCAIAPAEQDPRVFLLRPLFFQVRSSKAKVSRAGSRMTAKIDLTLAGLWIDRQERVHHETIAQTSWKISGYDMKATKPRYFYEYRTHGDAASDQVENHTAGWFVGIPLSFEHVPGEDPTRAVEGGPFKLTILVTERDESMATAYIERTSELLAENRERIVDLIETRAAPGDD